MNSDRYKTVNHCRRYRGTANRSRTAFVLLLTMIVLVVLASLAAGLSVHLTMANRRQQYMIEYQRARYGLDSAMKYIMSVMPTKTFKLTERADMPDFSDLFWMTDEQYGQFIQYWASTATEEQIETVTKAEALSEQTMEKGNEDLMSWLSSLFGSAPGGSLNDANSLMDPNGLTDPNAAWMSLDPNDITVPGPYGPDWPYVIEPIELKIGDSSVTITIEDENAKMPLSWMVTNFQQVNKQAEYSLETFGRWMQMSEEDIAELKASLDDVYKQKMFKVNPNPILLQQAATPTPPPTGAGANRFTSSRGRYARTTPGQSPQPQTPAPAQAAAKERPASAHATDFAKLFQSSLINQEPLARPLADTGTRSESALKYLSLWGSQRININTAPRHVLEAAFTLAVDSFDAPELAQKVIEQRKEKPFAKVEELKDAGMMDTETFNSVRNYVTTTSNFFKIRVTSQSGNATASAVATVIKEGKIVQPLAILYGY